MPRLEASVDTRLEASTSLDQAASCRTSHGAIVTGHAPPVTFFLKFRSKRLSVRTPPCPSADAPCPATLAGQSRAPFPREGRGAGPPPAHFWYRSRKWRSADTLK